MHEAEIYSFHGAVRTSARFDTVRLKFQPGNDWDKAQWIFEGSEPPVVLPAIQVNNIASLGETFDVIVEDGEGQSNPPCPAHAVLTGVPHGALCYIAREHETYDDLWEGLTVVKAFGKVVMAYFAFDPN